MFDALNNQPVESENSLPRDVRGTPPLFGDLRLICRTGEALGGAENMAMDEILLTELTGSVPILRVYAWAEPTLSFGYFINVAAAEGARRPGEKMVRRWTGGGMVHHGADFTWSLLVPHAHSVAKMRPAQCYVAVHEALGEALTRCGTGQIQVVPAEAVAPVTGLCFNAPAPGDVLWRGEKTAGAGQRRTRAGLLHQGSVQGAGLCLPDDFEETLASCLASRWTRWNPPAESVAAAVRLTEKYAAAAWTDRR